MRPHCQLDLFCHPREAALLAAFLGLELERSERLIAHLSFHGPDCGLFERRVEAAKRFDFIGRHTAGFAVDGAQYAPAVFVAWNGEHVDVPAVEEDNFSPIQVLPEHESRISRYQLLRRAFQQSLYERR